MKTPEPSPDAPSDFIRDIIRRDLETGKHQRAVTRFPPEPNGYLHIGHAKSICLNFGVAEEFAGIGHLRFDDTNPATEDPEYVEAIQRDIRWLGFDWGDRLFFASDYFAKLYGYAEQLIRRGMAYVDSLSEDEIREYRGTVTEPGRDSPYRDRSVDENLDLFRRMRAGEFANGAHVLRARIDMAAANMLMRDPLLYRIRRQPHYRTGDTWCVYPMYDFAHCLSDATEGITHSLCTLEFENNRELYDWILDHVDAPCHPQQIEFARLKLNYTVLSKRKLLRLVEDGDVDGWDDPRMPTLSGYRRRGYTPRSIRQFCKHIGVTKTNTTLDVGALEHAIRDDLNPRAPRVLAVLRPLKVVIDNYPEGDSEKIDAPYFPRDVPQEGSRPLPFARELYIERADFREQPPRKYYRLAPGRAVRLRHAYVIECREVRKNAAGEVVELRCTYDPASLDDATPGGKRIKGTIQWVSAAHAVKAEVRLYDRLFLHDKPDGDPDVDFKNHLNPQSLELLSDCLIEASVATAAAGERFQFERHGYFYLDPDDTTTTRPVFNRIVSLRDSWQKETPTPITTARPTKKAEIAASDDGGGGRAKRRKRTRSTVEARGLDPEQQARRQRYIDHDGLAEHEAAVLAAAPSLAALFAEARAVHDQPRSVAGWIVNELRGHLKDSLASDLPFAGAELGELAALVDGGTISGTAAKEVLTELLRHGGQARAIVEQRGLRLMSAADLETVIEQVLVDHGGQIAAYRAGKTALLGFFVGQVMKATRGRAQASQVQEILLRHLG